ncbi:MAG: hypothetical protein COB53_10655 [Elusimicrobia bacterium]|nr:MAG: hypothetical protein COB53_10655 [Elusimicrobiota bacterium]
MPLRALLTAALVIAPIALGATLRDETPDPYEVAIEDVRRGFLARTAVDEILTLERISSLEPAEAKPTAVENLKRIQFALPFIRSVQIGLATEAQRRIAFAALSIDDDGTLYQEGDPQVLSQREKEDLAVEAAEITTKYAEGKLENGEKEQITTRLAEIANALGVGPDAENFPGGGDVIQAGMIAPGDLLARIQNYAMTPTGLPTTLPTYAPPKPDSLVLQSESVGIGFRASEGTDYLSGNQGKLYRAVMADAETIIQDPKYKHGTYPVLYRWAPDRTKKQMVMWEILKDHRYGDEGGLAAHYNVEGMTPGEVADVDHFLAASLVGTVPVLGTVACAGASLAYDGGQMVSALFRGNINNAAYNGDQVMTDLGGCLHGFSNLLPGG